MVRLGLALIVVGVASPPLPLPPPPQCVIPALPVKLLLLDEDLFGVAPARFDSTDWLRLLPLKALRTESRNRVVPPLFPALPPLWWWWWVPLVSFKLPEWWPLVSGILLWVDEEQPLPFSCCTHEMGPQKSWVLSFKFSYNVWRSAARVRFCRPIKEILRKLDLIVKKTGLSISPLCLFLSELEPREPEIQTARVVEANNQELLPLAWRISPPCSRLSRRWSTWSIKTLENRLLWRR